MDRILAIPMFNSQPKAYLIGIDLHLRFAMIGFLDQQAMP